MGYCVNELDKYGIPVITPGGGLRFVHEPKTLRFFTGVLEPVSDWPGKLAEAYKADFSCEQ